MKCPSCGRELKEGDRLFMPYTLAQLVAYKTGIGFYTYRTADDLAWPSNCVNCAPGHVKRAALGITTITGAANLGAKEAKV